MMAKVFVCEETGWHLMFSPDSSRARNCYRQTMMTITVVTANILNIVRFDFRIRRHPHLPYIIGDGSEYLNDLSYFFIVSHVNLKLLHQYSIPVIMNTLYLSILLHKELVDDRTKDIREALERQREREGN